MHKKLPFSNQRLEFFLKKVAYSYYTKRAVSRFGIKKLENETRNKRIYYPADRPSRAGKVG